jgi:tripartite-type tricarboxylate transporter receptor subunit TctC
MLAAAVVAGALSGVAPAQSSYPARNIEFITPYPPGGISDTSLRVIQPYLAKELGVAVVNINKPGAGGQLAAEYCARGPADGYTVFNGANPIFTTARALRGRKLGITADDFVAIGSYTIDPTVLVVRSDSPFKTMAELVAHAKANPGKLNAGDGGIGGAGHFQLEAIKLIFGLQVGTVHFQGAGALLQQVMGGHIDMVLAGVSTFLPAIQAGQLRALTISAKHPDLPAVPSLADLKAADAAFSASQAFYVPKQTPPPVVQRLSVALAKVMAMPDAQAAVKNAGLLPRYVDGPGTTAALDREYNEAAKIVKALGLVSN